MIATFIQVLSSFQLVPPKVKRYARVARAPPPLSPSVRPVQGDLASVAKPWTCGGRLPSSAIGLPQVENYVEDLLRIWDFNADGAITIDEYKRGCVSHPEVITQLGLTRTCAQRNGGRGLATADGNRYGSWRRPCGRHRG